MHLSASSWTHLLRTPKTENLITSLQPAYHSAFKKAKLKALRLSLPDRTQQGKPFCSCRIIFIVHHRRYVLYLASQSSPSHQGQPHLRHGILGQYTPLPANDNDDEKENQGFMSAANFLGKEKAAPPNKKLPGHFFKRK